LFLTVNKHGKNTVKILQEIDHVYKSDQVLLVFPAGLVSRKQEGRIKDLEWKKSFITQAKKYKRPIVPVFIDGRNSKFFYSLANIRKKLGIEANIEMFYLADEMFKQKGRTITITFGKLIPAENFDNTKSDKQWAEWMKGKVYELENTNV
jgi:putative hemolysin